MLKIIKQHLVTILLANLLILLCAPKATCQTSEKASGNKPFPTKGHKEVTILTRTDVSADTLKTLLIVPNAESWIERGKKLQYFKEIMTLPELQKEIIAKGLTDKIPSISDRIGLYNAYLNYKPFVILMVSSEDLKTKGFRTRLSVYDPKRSETIFKNEVRLNLMWEGYSDQKVLHPLLNSLADYLNEQD